MPKDSSRKHFKANKLSLREDLEIEFKAFTIKNGAKRQYDSYYSAGSNPDDDADDELTELARRFRERVESEAEERGYQKQWISKNLRQMGALFRIRSERSNKGYQVGANHRIPKQLTKKQLEYTLDVIRETAKSLKLPSRTTNCIIKALREAYSVLT